MSNAEDDELKIEPQFRAPYDQILEPIKDDLAKINRTKQTMSDRLQQLNETAKGHIQAIFGCGLNADNNSNFIENTSNQSKFFGQISSSKNILVGLMTVRIRCMVGQAAGISEPDSPCSL
ncbi:hypothetical protein H7U34_00400 [Collinsella tanakaei]|nr:hypothetical protein [Collinsella tanakaei]